MDSTKKRVLVCPLDWGLGHATRCIPLIHALLNEGVNVFIAADGGPLALLRGEFPELTFITLSGYNIWYSKRMPMMLSMMLQSPKILFRILLEHNRLKRIIKNLNIDCVISDNRYGLWNKNLYTIFITHQLLIKCPRGLKFLEPILYRINFFFINKYDECWIPDFEGENNLSGKLSHQKPLPVNGTLIGLLSRFDSWVPTETKKKYDLLIILSGPEPHRSLLLERMLILLSSLNLSSLIVSGEPQKKEDRTIDETTRLVSHLNTNAMKEAIMQSDVVICRAGYSSIMDLVTLKKKGILIPTPGQTEQEYLAEYLKEKKVFLSVAQKEFQITTALHEINGFGDFSKISVEKKYVTSIKQLIKKITQ